MHYLRDRVPPLRELRRVLTDDGALVLSTHHPARDVRLSVTGNYPAQSLESCSRLTDRASVRCHVSVEAQPVTPFACLTALMVLRCARESVTLGGGTRREHPPAFVEYVQFA